MPTALFISPHLDDAVFSCGGTAARLASLGWRVVFATVFTATVPEPRGFALVCQTNKGIPPGADYMALRRAEDEEAAATLGAEALWLGHPEAPHRGYESASELFGGVHEKDMSLAEVSWDLTALVRSVSPTLVFAPQGLGNHVDHYQTVRALDTDGVLGGMRERILYYRDTPYAIREPEAAPSLTDLPAMGEFGVGIDSDLAIKLRACASYASQLGQQFGGEDGMRSALERFASSESKRLGLKGLAEAHLSLPAAARALRRSIR